MGGIFKKRLKDDSSKTSKFKRNTSDSKPKISESFVTLTKEEVEKSRSAAYEYVL